MVTVNNKQYHRPSHSNFEI